MTIVTFHPVSLLFHFGPTPMERINYLIRERCRVSIGEYLLKATLQAFMRGTTHNRNVAYLV
jgi:hypothetical protein